MSVLPDGYAGGLLLWLPQSEPAGGSSPIERKCSTQSLMCIQPALDTVPKVNLSTDKTRLVTKWDNV